MSSCFDCADFGHRFLFFALFSVIGKTSAFIGPFVSEAIITASGNNNNMPFAFLFGLGCFSAIFLLLVDMDKSRKECDAFVNAEARHNAFAADSVPVAAVVEKTPKS